jgi:hypothetical protein
MVVRRRHVALTFSFTLRRAASAVGRSLRIELV